MERVAIVGLSLPAVRELGRFEVHGVAIPQFGGWRPSVRVAIREGLSGVYRPRSVLKAEWVDELYREQDPSYLAGCEKLIADLKFFDVVVFSTFCPLHPELIRSHLRKQVKVLGFSDDPHSTYVRGVPYLSSFDAAYYISPSYSELTSFQELFELLKFTKVRWLPLVQPHDYPSLDIGQIRGRSITSCYVGNPTGSKFDRIVRMKQTFGSEFVIRGRWPLGGYFGFARPLVGETPFFTRVRPISSADKEQLYINTKIGFNMHVSDRPAESGNMRTYDIAGYGMMPLCDRGARNLQASIFEEGTESVYYSSFDEALELLRHFRSNDADRSRIAFAAHRRACADYRWDKVWLDFLNWL